MSVHLVTWNLFFLWFIQLMTYYFYQLIVSKLCIMYTFLYALILGDESYESYTGNNWFCFIYQRRFTMKPSYLLKVLSIKGVVLWKLKRFFDVKVFTSNRINWNIHRTIARMLSKSFVQTHCNWRPLAIMNENGLFKIPFQRHTSLRLGVELRRSICRRPVRNWRPATQ